VNILRRLPLSRLLLLCALVVGLGASATAIALAVGSGPTPPAKPLAVAVHDALQAPPVEGVTASVKLTNHLLEGASLAGGEGEAAGQLAGSPLISGGSGRLWISKDGRVRLELQAENGDTQVIYDGKRLTMYDASSNTLYRYTLPAKHDAALESGKTETSSDGSTSTTLIYKPDSAKDNHAIPSVAKIEEKIAELGKHANVAGATPTDVAGQAAYTARISPKEGGSLIGGAELSWDAVHGVPLRLALYSSTSSSPVIELAASDISYGPVPDSVFELSTPPNAKVEEVTLPEKQADKGTKDGSAKHAHPDVSTVGKGVSGVAVIQSKVKPGEKPLTLPAGLQKVKVGSASATELPTALGTLLSFERSGVRYLLVGSVTPAAIEAVARGL
jgi:outer membrane lipoprotein-sorting protein